MDLNPSLLFSPFVSLTQILMLVEENAECMPQGCPTKKGLLGGLVPYFDLKYLHDI